jgi:glucose/arabinose dehydrogenase
LGIDLHPDFSENGFVYLYYTYRQAQSGTLNRVVRMAFEGGKLVNEQIILDAIPGASNHNGGRIKFGPDGYLYVTAGDAQSPSLAQDVNSLAGKIMRITDEGAPAPGNPFGNLVYSFGHRNPQGIDWDENGNLWSTEHGPSGFETGNDELNKIEAGKNYGWPEIRGTEVREGMEAPVLESGRNDTWAPAGLAHLNGKLYFTGLRGAALYEVSFDNGRPVLKEYFKNEMGRLRDVVAGPDGMLYLTTSNRDGRGIPKRGDDKILMINPYKLGQNVSE